MRAITRDELSAISGGLARSTVSSERYVQFNSGKTTSLSTVRAATGSTDEQEFELLTKSVISLGEQGALDSGLSDIAFKSLDWAGMAADVNSQLFAQAEHDYTTFEQNDGEHDPPGYINVVQWNHVNWHAYDANGTATPAQAVNNLMRDIDVNHHFSADKNTVSSNIIFDGYEGGWAYDGPNYAEFIAMSGGFDYITPTVTVGPLQQV